MAKGRKTGGRKPGSPNKLTVDLRSMIRGSLEELGGQAYLREQGEKNPKAYLALVAKLLPTELTGALDLHGSVSFYLPTNGRDD